MTTIPVSARWLLCLLLVLSSPLPQAAGTADPPPAGVHSKKKGLGIGTDGRYPDWARRLERLNVAWFYTWRAQHPGKVPEGVEFVPMVFGRRGADTDRVAELVNGARNGQYRNLLGFNEPDVKAQANLPVDEAAKLWSRLAATGLRVGSPAPVSALRPWMQDFMARVEQDGGRVDFIALHWYGGPHARRLLLHLERVHQRYGRPIWITEFAVADWDARKTGVSRYTAAEALDFMNQVLPEIERLDYVERYAWFSPSPDSPALAQSALFDREGGLTPLGRRYAGH